VRAQPDRFFLRVASSQVRSRREKVLRLARKEESI
jgi:hypothetical protein